jgi:hypothetical protein
MSGRGRRVSGAQMRIGSPSRWSTPSYDTVAQAVRAVVGTGVREVQLNRQVGRVLNRLGLIPRRGRPVVLTPVMGQSWHSVAAACSSPGTCGNTTSTTGCGPSADSVASD